MSKALPSKRRDYYLEALIRELKYMFLFRLPISRVLRLLRLGTGAQPELRAAYSSLRSQFPPTACQGAKTGLLQSFAVPQLVTERTLAMLAYNMEGGFRWLLPGDHKCPTRSSSQALVLPPEDICWLWIAQAHTSPSPSPLLLG